MNLPVLTQGGATMSSLDIAAVTGKEHGHVMRDIRAVLNEAGIDESKFGGIYLDAYNREKPCFNLPRRECDLVVSGYSVKYRLAIIDRWRELEAKQSFEIPATLPEALRLAADLAEKNEALSLENSELKPKAEFHDLVTASDDLCQLATAAQVLNLPFGRNTLFQRLRNRGVLLSGGDRHNLPKQEQIKLGRFTVKESTFLDEDKQPHVRFTTYVTQKGLVWLAKEFQPKHEKPKANLGSAVWNAARNAMIEEKPLLETWLMAAVFVSHEGAVFTIGFSSDQRFFRESLSRYEKDIEAAVCAHSSGQIQLKIITLEAVAA